MIDGKKISKNETSSKNLKDTSACSSGKKDSAVTRDDSVPIEPLEEEDDDDDYSEEE